MHVKYSDILGWDIYIQGLPFKNKAVSLHHRPSVYITDCRFPSYQLGMIMWQSLFLPLFTPPALLPPPARRISWFAITLIHQLKGAFITWKGKHILHRYLQVVHPPTIAMSTAQRQLAIEKTMEVSKYMKASLKNSLQNGNAQVEIPDDWSLEFTQDCEYMVHLLLKALRNQGISLLESSISWW